MKSEIQNPRSEIRNPRSEITILIVDDTRLLNDSSARILRNAGYNVVQAFDGNECLEILKTLKPDLLLLDVIMPGMDGIEVCRKIKSAPETSGLFIILQSGLRTSTDNQAEGLEAGADGYIARPLNNREFLARVEAALRIVESESNLASLNATKDLFLSIIAHDLKNPFNTIIGFSELMLEKENELSREKSAEYLKVISDCATRAYSLLENLLLWGKAQSGKINFIPINLNLSDCISEALSLIYSQALAKNINISTSVDSTCTVYGDKNMIMTILRNILSNAVKFTPRDGNISIAVAENNEMAEIHVTDSGVGMSKEFSDKLFSIENANSTSGTNNEKGTGLGLLLCKEFVELNGGKIWVESEEGKGSKFIFTLPKTGVIQ